MPSRRPSVALVLVEQEAVVWAYLTSESPSRAPRNAAPLLTAHPGPLQLVMGTYSMHFVTGRELAAVLEAVQPPVPVFVVSGHRWNRTLREGRLAENRALLKVPYDPELVRANIAALRADPAAA